MLSPDLPTIIPQDPLSLPPLPLQLPDFSAPGILVGQSPQDPGLWPRIPEQEVSLWRSPHEADFDTTKNHSTSSDHHESVHQHLGCQNDTSSSQRIPNISYEGSQPQIRPTSHLTSSPHSTSSGQEPTEPGSPVQIPSRQTSSRSRRNHNRQFKCTSCSKVFQRRCDLKYRSLHPKI